MTTAPPAATVPSPAGIATPVRVRRRLALLLVLAALALGALLAAAGPAAAQAPPQRTTVEAVEAHLMCITCGEALARSTASQADDERDQIAVFVRQGKTEQQAIDGMVAIYGEQVLIDPPQDGVRIVRIVVPVAAVLLAAILALVLVRRWRGRDTDEPPAPRGGPGGSGSGLTPDDAARLDSDLARYR